MPRDLFAQNQEEGMTESPDAQTPKAGEPMESNGYHDFAIHSGDPDQNYPQALRRSKKAQRKAALHPYVQTLSIADLDSCERLERSCFPEERCIREKVCISVSVQSIVFDVIFSAVLVYGGGIAMWLRMSFDLVVLPNLSIVPFMLPLLLLLSIMPSLLL